MNKCYSFNILQSEMETKQRSQHSLGMMAGNKQGVKIGFMAQEQPSPDPKTNPDMPPGPAKREYDDTGHEHEHKNPTAI